MSLLVLVRHGESVYNAEGRIQGQQCAGLSPLGHDQAAATARLLADAYPQAQLVTSDLQRTRETVAPLERALQREARSDARLRERSFGAWEGHLRVEIERDDPDRWGRWNRGEDVVVEVGGESRAQLVDRVLPALLTLVEEVAPGGVTIAVTHGGPVWHGLHRLLDLDRSVLGPVSNSSVTTVARFREQPVLLGWNDVGHLPSELRERWQVPARSSDGPPVGH